MINTGQFSEDGIILVISVIVIITVAYINIPIPITQKILSNIWNA